MYCTATLLTVTLKPIEFQEKKMMQGSRLIRALILFIVCLSRAVLFVWDEGSKTLL